MPAKTSGLLVVHFHGATWLAELSARQAFPGAAILAIQVGPSSDPYAQAFAPSGRFRDVLAEAEHVAGVRFPRVILSSFSAGYGAMREILKDPANLPRVAAVVFVDSMHAEYGREDADLGAFVAFARDAAAGRKQMILTHSEVFPGTYASTTEAADHILKRLGARRRAVLKWGSIGMQQVSEFRMGGLTVMGFAGNSAPDHADHLQAMRDFYRRVRIAAPAVSKRQATGQVQPAQMKR